MKSVFALVAFVLPSLVFAETQSAPVTQLDGAYVRQTMDGREYRCPEYIRVASGMSQNLKYVSVYKADAEGHVSDYERNQLKTFIEEKSKFEDANDIDVTKRNVGTSIDDYKAVEKTRGMTIVGYVSNTDALKYSRLTKTLTYKRSSIAIPAGLIVKDDNVWLCTYKKM